jgi:hypothetical protein
LTKGVKKKMNCDNNCKICPRIVISTAVTVVTVDGVDTLVIDLPTAVYGNACKYCIVVAQAIPATATINMPVAFSIGGDTTTVYPFMNCNCVQVTASGVQTRTRYPVAVLTNATSGVFRSLKNIRCYPINNLSSIPVPATTAADTPATGG